MDSGLQDQRVLVTGASGGIGRAVAAAFAAEGARLVLHAFRHRTAAEELAGTLGVPSLVVTADLREEGQVEALFAAADAAWGGLDRLVVNAGIWNPAAVPLHRMSLAQWRETLDADLTSAFLTCRAFFRRLELRRPETASIVLVGSTAALFGEENHADYAVAKAGLVYGLTRTLKNEIVRVVPRGRVNCVCPGWVDTAMSASHTGDPALVERATATMPLRKIASPADVAAAIVFLSSDALAGHVSGAILPIAGGMEGRWLHPHA